MGIFLKTFFNKNHLYWHPPLSRNPDWPQPIDTQPASLSTAGFSTPAMQTGPPRCRGLFRGIASPAILLPYELVLYGIRLLAPASLGKLSTNERRASTFLDEWERTTLNTTLPPGDVVETKNCHVKHGQAQPGVSHRVVEICLPASKVLIEPRTAATLSLLTLGLSPLPLSSGTGRLFTGQNGILLENVHQKEELQGGRHQDLRQEEITTLL